MTQAIKILDDLSRRRRALGMPYGELSRLCSVSISTLKRVMHGEVTASFLTVFQIADALGLRLAEAPTQDVASMRDRQARDKAHLLVAQLQGSSALEAQAVVPTDVELMEQRTAAELLSGSARRLWAR